jgi:hypothetical protein
VQDLLVSCDHLRFTATANTKARVRAAIAFEHLPAQSHTIKPFGAIDDYLETQKATANTQRERLNSTETFARRQTRSGDVRPLGHQRTHHGEIPSDAAGRGASNRTVNMDEPVGCLW